MSGGVLSPAVDGQGTVLANERILPAPGPLAPLVPGGLQRGSLVGVWGPGAVTLLLSLLVEPLAQGSWAAVVGMPDLGLEAAAGMGVDLGRFALVPDPGTSWPGVVAVLLDAMDLVVVRPPGHCRPGDARRLAARARERGSVLVIAGGRPWPDHPDLEFTVDIGDWEGLGIGSGTLRCRPATVVVSGRRHRGRPGTTSCWLPGPDGRLSLRHATHELTLERVGREDPETMAWAG